ncbi:MAG TPA: hypothetical protein VHX88_16150 [Solirubrobacteraceae bacterium]|jgi:hypothetical protein|nr:hypothetical protein [Solirubrobacteraceae bacterium]
MPRVRTRVTAALAGGALLSALALPALQAGEAQAATLPTLPVSTLTSALDAIPGLNSTEISQLVSQIESLQTTGSAPTLLSDLSSVLGPVGTAAGQPDLVASVLDTVSGLLGDILGGGTPNATQVEALINQLETAASAAGVPATGSHALSQLAAALTTGDLASLLAYPGSPLSSTEITGILSELSSLQGLPTGSTLPTGALGDVAAALEQVATTSGVPAPVASALENVAATLASSGSLSPTQLSGVLSTLEGQTGALGSVPVLGPELEGIVGSLTTELASLPAVGGVLGSSGSGSGGSGSGGSGGSGGGTPTSTNPSSSNPNSNYYADLGSTASNSKTPASVAKRTVGAKIAHLKASKGKVKVTVSCPSTATGGCSSIVYLGVGGSHLSSKPIRLGAGRSGSVALRLPHKALAAVAKHRQLTVSCVTGSVTVKRSFHGVV